MTSRRFHTIVAALLQILELAPEISFLLIHLGEVDHAGGLKTWRP